jgi:hypothetical protein
MMDSNQEEMKAEMKTNQEKIDDGQEEMKAQVASRIHVIQEEMRGRV